MNVKQGIEPCIFELVSLISDYSKIGNENLRNHDAELIVAKARELVQLATPKKAEMPCNCIQDKDADRILQAAKAFDDFLVSISKIK